MQKIGSDELALNFRELNMRHECLFHLACPVFKCREQVAVAALEVFQDILKHAIGRLRIERQNPIDDVVCARLIGRVEIPWLRRRFEGTNNDTRRIGTQKKRLAVQKSGLGQN